MNSDIYTIGHSNHDMPHFIGLLKLHQIEAVADVRQSPYSKIAPQFNREVLKNVLISQQISYVFLGNMLGARPTDPECYRDGKVDFDILARQPYFQNGLDRLRKGIQKMRLTLMCAEKDPLTCHRTILVCQNLKCDGLRILHILEDGELEDHRDTEARLLNTLKMPTYDMFKSQNEILKDAYQRYGRKIAASDEVLASY
ncbi:MAG: DUF488 domain-containing protein [Bacteroidales bacterium]|nr:DUF488 domain-containing protein [Bacteroidales bacterium]